ncbi:hypothetical protein D3C81_1799850 [compost metagenome]
MILGMGMVPRCVLGLVQDQVGQAMGFGQVVDVAMEDAVVHFLAVLQAVPQVGYILIHDNAPYTVAHHVYLRLFEAYNDGLDL